MSLFKRFFLLGSVLLLAAFCLTLSPVAPIAHAASVSASTHALSRTPSALSPLPGPWHELVRADAHALSRTPSAVSPDFTCPSATICFFQNDDYTGATISCATDVCRGAWYATTVGGGHAGSVHDNSNSIFFVGDVQDQLEYCELPGKYELNQAFGYYYVEYGVTSCNGAFVPQLP